MAKPYPRPVKLIVRRRSGNRTQIEITDSEGNTYTHIQSIAAPDTWIGEYRIEKKPDYTDE